MPNTTVQEHLFTEPPYHELRPLPPRGRLPDAALFAVRVTGPATDPGGLREKVDRLRTLDPAVPVVLLVDAATPAELALLRFQAAPLGVRGVVAAEEELAASLRSQLVLSPDLLARQIVDWLPFSGVTLSPPLAHLITRVFTLAPAHTQLRTLLDALHEPGTSARFRCRKKHLPPPGSWFQVARALHAALRLQRDPRSSVLEVALAAGYSDHSALSQQFHRCFHLRPVHVRGTLGWEWLLLRWLRSAAAHPSPAP